MLVTLADGSGTGDGCHMREAYATMVLDDTAVEASRRIITPMPDGSACPAEATSDGEYFGFPVDAGTACFVDDGAGAVGMPEDSWYDDQFDNGSSDRCFERMDAPHP